MVRACDCPLVHKRTADVFLGEPLLFVRLCVCAALHSQRQCVSASRQRPQNDVHFQDRSQSCEPQLLGGVGLLMDAKLAPFFDFGEALVFMRKGSFFVCGLSCFVCHACNSFIRLHVSCLEIFRLYPSLDVS